MTQEFNKKEVLSSLARSHGDRCPECREGRIAEDEHTGERVCTDCGVVIDQNTSEVLLPQEPHSTPLIPGARPIIESATKDAMGKPVSGEIKQTIIRLKKYNVVKENAKERRQKNLALILDRTFDNLHLPQSLKESVSQLMNDTEDLLKGRGLDVIVAASIYMICRRNGIPKKLTEVAEVAGVMMKPLSKCYRIMLREISLTGSQELRDKYMLPTQDPATCISQISSRLHLPEQVARLAIRLIRDNPKNLMGSDPFSVSASALFIACNMNPNCHRTQKDIASASGITEVTIRNNLRKFTVIPAKKLLI